MNDALILSRVSCRGRKFPADLPIQLTSFVGRERELGEVKRLLATTRLLTLTGSGGAGCSHGLAATDNTVFRVNPDGTTTTIADLSAFQKANPVAHPEPDDFEPDGTWYSMIARGGVLYAVEPNHGELDRILPNGKIQRVVDISASQGHIVPTSVKFHHGDFYIGNLSTFPVVPGSSEILKINNGGKVKAKMAGLTMVLGVAFDDEGCLYALDTETGILK